jgi:hypothetical protein
MKETALKALRDAYEGYPVTFSEVDWGSIQDSGWATESASKSQKKYDRKISIKNLFVGGKNGETYPLDLSSNVYFWTVETMMRSLAKLGCRTLTYPECMNQTGLSLADLIRALSTGVGNTAAHELGHQRWLGFTTDRTDCSDCYDGQIYVDPHTQIPVNADPWFFGPLHWSKDAERIMKEKLTLRY